MKLPNMTYEVEIHDPTQGKFNVGNANVKAWQPVPLWIFFLLNIHT